MEIWIAIRKDANRGTGTQKDPYNGSTMSMFDEVMAAQPPVSLIHIGPGLFRTGVVRNWVMRPGWQIEGAGMYGTTIQFGGPAPAAPYIISVLTTDWNVPSDNVGVRRLTCDSNWAEIGPSSPGGAGGEKNCKTGAVSIGGNKAIIDQVRSINSYGSWANGMEQFAFVVSAGNNPNDLGVNNVIQFCRAELPAGNYGSPYAIFGVSKALVRSCFAQGQNNGTTSAWNTGGVNLANVHNSEIDGCTFIDCMTAAYHDTNIIDGLLLKNCVLIRGSSGFMNNSPNADRNVTVVHNHFQIQNRQGGSWCLGIGNIGTGTLAGIDLEDNEIVKDATGHGQNNLIGISLRGGSIAKVLRNIVDGSDDSNFVPPGTQCYGNRDLNGRAVPGLLDTISPTPVGIKP